MCELREGLQTLQALTHCRSWARCSRMLLLAFSVSPVATMCGPAVNVWSSEFRVQALACFFN